MKSIHWLILNVSAWVFTAGVAIELEMASIMWAPACVSLALIIGLSLTSGLTDR